MIKARHLWLGLGASLAITSCAAPDIEESGTEARPSFDLVSSPIGAVEFEVSCNAKASDLVERGVALTHHMMYEEANFVFGMAGNADPDCAMANWGQAMAIINPLWPTTPSMEKMQRGVDLVEKSMAQSSLNEREQAYLQTTMAYFVGGESRSEQERLTRFQSAWADLHSAFPDDEDAEAFFLLSSLAIADPNDRTLSTQRRVGDGLEAMLEARPDHPGVLHYLIHAYDFPQLAQRALPVADHYGEVTPLVPHATHMMTHIYTRLGLWEKAIEWNSLSAETALSICKETGTINGHYTHALDYLAYAYLQTGDDTSVLEIIATAEALSPPYSGNLHATAYAFSAIPARYALERRDWQAAASLEPRWPSEFPWNEAFEPYVAITHFARAIGLARSGQAEHVDTELAALRALRDSVAERSGYWAEQIEIQIQTAEAWRLYASGDASEGLARMQSASDLSMTTEKSGITPGEALPTTELLGDMLMEMERYEDALSAYEKSLERSPHRLNSLSGAAQAATMSENPDAAAIYLADIVRIAEGENVTRPIVLQARATLNGE